MIFIVRQIQVLARKHKTFCLAEFKPKVYGRHWKKKKKKKKKKKILCIHLCLFLIPDFYSLDNF